MDPLNKSEGTLEGFRQALAHVGTTGAIRTAALGSPVPKMEPEYFTDIFRNLGYIGPDGISVSFDEDATEFIPLQEIAPIRREITKSVTAIKFVLWQSSRQNFAFYLGGKVEVNDDGTWYIDVGGKPDFPRQLFSVDIIDGDAAARIILPNGQLTERGDVVFKSDEIIGLECTITAFPADSGDYPGQEDIWGKQARWYFSEEWDSEGAYGSDGPLDINTSALPAATVDEEYSFNLTNTGGAGSVTWTIADNGDPLPAGLELSDGGALSGTPTAEAVGEHSLAVRAEDATGRAAERRLALTVSENP